MSATRAPAPPVQLSLFDALPALSPLDDSADPRAGEPSPHVSVGAPASLSGAPPGPQVPLPASITRQTPEGTEQRAAVPLPGPSRRPGTDDNVLPIHRHPRAAREIRLGEHRVSYELRRARRRTIGFLVGPEGLTVSAPRWVGSGEIETALREKGNWILRKLHEQHERSQRLAQSRIVWRDGATFPFLGETVIVVLDPRITGSALRNAEGHLPGVPGLTLHLGLPQEAAPEQIRDAVQSWLQRQARRIFEERAAVFAARLNVRFARLALSAAATRWGSANADGSIRLNWRLVHYALPVIDYVVTHELAHLREMNHSPAFWDVVRSAMPDFEAARGALRTEVVPAFE